MDNIRHDEQVQFGGSETSRTGEDGGVSDRTPTWHLSGQMRMRTRLESAALLPIHSNLDREWMLLCLHPHVIAP